MKKLITLADNLAAATAAFLETTAMPNCHEWATMAAAAKAYNAARAAAPAKKEKEPSALGGRFAEWCAKEGGLINLRVTQLSLRKWALCYDALVEKDGHSAKHISDVWTFAREHSFYQGVVITPLKLRTNDPNGVRWFDRLALDMARTKPKGAPVQRIKGKEL